MNSEYTTQVPTTPDCYKFVRVNGQFRFTEDMWGCGHAGCVGGGEKATDAGFLYLYSESFRIEHGSMSLKIGCSEEAHEALAALIVDRAEREEYC